MTAASDSARAAEERRAPDRARAQWLVPAILNPPRPFVPNDPGLIRVLEGELARARRIGEASERLRCVLYLRELASEEDGATGASERVAEALEIAAQFVENSAHPQVKS